MTLHLYNTLTRAKAPFAPLDPGNVRVYVCGPTVYDLAHIGNARPVVVFDVLFRLLRHLYGAAHVTYARNITDVDDKIIAAARESGEPIERLTARTTEAFHADMAALGALAPTVEPRATGHIPQMIAMIEALIARGHAYAADGHVLFSVPSMPDYGRLSRRNREELIAGARVEVAPYKADPADFVLWKPSAPEQPGWDSPWGRGRPGWHIECSAMSAHHLGQPFDIHGGGQDLIFPHHENEIAQSTCACQREFVRVWMHNGYVTVDGQKMSKSLGNFITVHEILTKDDWGHENHKKGEAIRLTLLTAHYRQPLDFTWGKLEEARARLNHWYRALNKLNDVPAEPAGQLPVEQATVMDDLSDDLNTPLAISRLDVLVDYAHDPKKLDDLTYSPSGAKVKISVGQIKHRIIQSAELLGVLQTDPEFWFHGAVGEDAAEIKRLIAERAAARMARDFAEADRIRDELKKKGIVLEDRPDGTTDWRRA
ncbi:MAG: cysteine--tRNA ligase [Kiloniellaceae bacterium]